MALRLKFLLILVMEMAFSTPTRAQQEIFDFVTVGVGLYFPNGIAVDASNSVFVTDSGNHVIRQLTAKGSNWVFTTIAGVEGVSGSTDGTNNGALFHGPTLLAFGPEGNLFVTDDETVRELRQYGTNWVVSTICGVAEIRGSADGTNADVRFSNPRGIAADRAGSVYVAAFENYTIRKLTKIGTNWISSTIAGLAKTSGMDNGTNNTARFVGPNSLCVDPSGNLYLTDHLSLPNSGGRDRIRVLTPVGTNWVVNDLAFDASAVPFFVAESAVGLTVGRQGQIYSASAGSPTIVEITPRGTNLVESILAGSPVASGTADGTNTAARFYLPCDVALDGAGNLYVLDGYYGTIRRGIRLAPPRPLLGSVSITTNASFALTWNASLGSTYQVQYNPDLSLSNWINLGGGSIMATNELISVSDAAPPPGRGFYRVVLLP